MYQSCCGNRCVDTRSDQNHCGDCGTVCKGGTICVDTECVCPSGESDCPGGCVNLQTDPSNCGACGKLCIGISLRCVNGICI
jgi:hypothetical protein